jgi:hypothetical protein
LPWLSFIGPAQISVGGRVFSLLSIQTRQPLLHFVQKPQFLATFSTGTLHQVNAGRLKSVSVEISIKKLTRKHYCASLSHLTGSSFGYGVGVDVDSERDQPLEVVTMMMIIKLAQSSMDGPSKGSEPTSCCL